MSGFSSTLVLVVLAWVSVPVAIVGDRVDAAPPVQASPPDCNAPMHDAVAYVEMPGNAFQPVPTADGCWIFVSIVSQTPATRGIAVLHRGGGKIGLTRFVRLPAAPTDMAMTHDGSRLFVAANDLLIALDVPTLISGRGTPIVGMLPSEASAQRINAGVSLDDQLLFVSDERESSIEVVALNHAPMSGDVGEPIGRIPVGNAPIALVPTLDGRYLLTTSQAAPPALGWPRACRPENSAPGTAPNHAQGAILVVDLARAERDPARAVVAATAAGCNPVRLALSPDGARTYVTARGDNAVLAFETDAVVRGTATGPMARVPVGTAPVGIAVIAGGRELVVTNSNRFNGGAGDRQSLTVIDTARLSAGAAAVLGSIPAGAFPRELKTTADGRTLLATNFTSKTLEVIDLDRLRFAPR